VPGPALVLQLLLNQARTPRAYVSLGLPCNCIFSLFNETLVLDEDFRNQTGSVPAGEASAGLSQAVVVLQQNVPFSVSLADDSVLLS